MPLYETYLTIKQATFDLPDLQVNPRNKMTRLMKNLKWGVKIDGKPDSPEERLFNPDPKKKYEVIGDDSSDLASCVDLTNRVVKNTKGVGSLATLTNFGEIPHLTPMFKHKGKYYIIHGEHQYSKPYDKLEDIGGRWYTDPNALPVPEYIDFYDLPADEIITETDLRKVIEEVKRKARKTYRKYYTDRPGYKVQNDKYTIHGAILGCLGNNAKKFDYNITEELPNDPWKAIINTKPMTMEQVQQFHKYHRKDVDKAGVPYYFLTRNERTGEKAVWYSDDPNPIPINNKKQVEQAKQIGISKGLVPDQLDFKFTKESKAINFPEEELANLKGKDHFYTTRVSSDYNKYNLGDTVTTPWGDVYDIVSEDKYNNLKDHKFYDELTDEQKRLLAAYKKIKLLGLTKKSSVDISDIVNAYKNQYGFDLSHMKGKHSKKPRYNNGKVANDIPVDAYGGSWAKNNTIYLNPNMDAVAKYYGIADAIGLQDTIVAHELAHEIYKRQATQEFIKQILEEAKKKKFTTPYLATVPEHKLDEETFCEYLANGLNKKASKLYTYVDPDADLSQGLLSARLAPEDALLRRYPKGKSKAELIKMMEDYGDPYSRPDLIYALDAPIPDTATEKLRRFRDTHKLVSYDPKQIKDLVKLLKRRYRQPPVEITPDFEPRKYVQWGRNPKDGGAFFYAPVYKVLTESGKIPPEILNYE